MVDGNIVIADPRPAHRASLRRHINLSRIRKAGLRVVIDSMHGCGGRLLEELIGGETIAAERDVYFGGRNPEPIRKNLGPLCAAVKRQHADLGLATDGDADRLGVVDDKGRYVSIQLVFALLLLHMIRHKRQVDGEVVKSSNCSVLIERICHAHNLKCVTVPVGFKHICARMREHDVLIGGEESGGIGFRGHMPERDGILACLMVLEMLAVTGQTLSQALKDLQHEFGRSSYDRLDLRYPLEQRQTLMRVLQRDPPARLLNTKLVQVTASDGIKYIAQDDSWLMFRGSGTEPVLRIYSEARTPARVRQLLEWGERRAREVSR